MTQLFSSQTLVNKKSKNSPYKYQLLGLTLSRLRY